MNRDAWKGAQASSASALSKCVYVAGLARAALRLALLPDRCSASPSSNPPYYVPVQQGSAFLLASRSSSLICLLWKTGLGRMMTTKGNVLKELCQANGLDGSLVLGPDLADTTVTKCSTRSGRHWGPGWQHPMTTTTIAGKLLLSSSLCSWLSNHKSRECCAGRCTSTCEPK